MDFVTIFFLLIPLIALYVRTPSGVIPAHTAALDLGETVLLSALYFAAALLVFRIYLARRLAKARKGSGEVTLKAGRANNIFVYGLTALFFVEIHVLRIKESFETLFFSSEVFLISDLLLLSPFLLPFLLFRANTSLVLLESRGIQATWRSEFLRQCRTVGILLLPQLLYLNLYRTIVSDVPGLDRWFEAHPLYGFVVAGTLLFILFVLSPFFIRLLFARIELAQHPAGPELAPRLSALANRSGIALDRVFVWLTGKRRIANAAVSGLFGRQRTVFLTDHLLSSLNSDEVVAVVAHEVGHARLKHLFFNFLLAMTSGIFVIWGLVLLAGMVHSQEEVGIVVIGLEIIYIFLVFGAFARRFEKQADLYAAYVTGSPRTVASALLRLAATNHVSVRRGSITHPSIHARVQRLGRLLERYGTDLSRPIRRAKLANGATAVFLVVAFALTIFLLDYLPL